MQIDSLHHEEAIRNGYKPKMLLFTLDELFYIFDQIRRQRSMDEKIVVAYKILCLSTQWCTEQWHGVEKTSLPNALSLLNVNGAHHLEHLTWAVYDGALLVGGQPKLPGDHPWCTVLASLYKHIYRGCNDMAHCLPHTLGSWDCQERIEVLCRGDRLSSTRSSWRRAFRARRRFRSSSQCRSQTLAWGNRDGMLLWLIPLYAFEMLLQGNLFL